MVWDSLLGDREEGVNRWAWIGEDGRHTNPTPPNSLYFWAGLSLITFKFDGRAAYMETCTK